jgi:acyl carrier protein
VASLTESEVIEAVTAIVRDEIDAKAVVHSESDLLRDLRLDSLSLMTLVVGLEDRFQIVLSEEDSAGIRTVGELAALVLRKAAA